MSAGDIAASMVVLELPPSDSRKSHVKTESRYLSTPKQKKLYKKNPTNNNTAGASTTHGTWLPPLAAFEERSARAEITSPSVVSDLLMFAPSLSRSPVAPVDCDLSLPARSTRFSLLDCKTAHGNRNSEKTTKYRPVRWQSSANFLRRDALDKRRLGTPQKKEMSEFLI